MSQTYILIHLCRNYNTVAVKTLIRIIANIFPVPIGGSVVAEKSCVLDWVEPLVQLTKVVTNFAMRRKGWPLKMHHAKFMLKVFLFVFKTGLHGNDLSYCQLIKYQRLNAKVAIIQKPVN